MQRYFLEQLKGYIDGDDFKHITKVMRMNVGDKIIVCAKGMCYDAHISKIDQQKVYYQQDRQHEQIKFPHITLFQGMPKYAKVDEIIKYSTIFGASEIVFAQMHRSVAKVSQIESKVDRFHKIAKEASELAHRQSVPTISFSKNIDKIDFSNYDYVLLADEYIKDTSVNYDIEDLDAQSKIAIIIGPEGGISENERSLLLQKKIKQISLGTYILPTEIANLYVISIISAKFHHFFDK